MIKIIKSNELQTNADLVCTHCGAEHNYSVEGIDYVFEKDIDTNEEWFICIECKNRYCEK